MAEVRVQAGHPGPLGWQRGVAGVPGLDWEVIHPARRWCALLFWEKTLMAVVYSRWRPLLRLRMLLVQSAVVRAVRLGPPTAQARPEKGAGRG